MNNREKACLICEEEPEVTHCLEMAITSFGCSVQSARDGNAAVSRSSKR